MAGGTWWRDTGTGSEGDGEGVYVPQQPSGPPAPERPAPPMSFDKPGLSFDKPALGEQPPPDDLRRAIESAATSGRRTDVTGAFPGWDTVYFDFHEERPAEPAEPAVPEQPVAVEAAEEPSAAGAAADRSGLLAGRRPAPLLLVGALALLAGALTGSFLAMLAGWGAAYLSRGLGDFGKKFVVLGIPLITMTGSAVWMWGRSRGRWGQPLAAGGDFGQATWSAAPGVLRVAAVLSAVCLLAVTLRRREAL